MSYWLDGGNKYDDLLKKTQIQGGGVNKWKQRKFSLYQGEKYHFVKRGRCKNIIFWGKYTPLVCRRPPLGTLTGWLCSWPSPPQSHQGSVNNDLIHIQSSSGCPPDITLKLYRIRLQLLGMAFGYNSRSQAIPGAAIPAINIIIVCRALD